MGQSLRVEEHGSRGNRYVVENEWKAEIRYILTCIMHQIRQTCKPTHSYVTSI